MPLLDSFKVTELKIYRCRTCKMHSLDESLVEVFA